MLWYISVCSMIGGISVSVTTGLGSAIVTTAMGDNQVHPLLLGHDPVLTCVFAVQTLVYLFLDSICCHNIKYVRSRQCI